MSDGTPQFTTAEYAPKSAGQICKVCSKPVAGAYYRLNGAPACAACTERIKTQLADDPHPPFVRGVTFGIAGAILGMVVYVGFALATGLVIGFVSLAVGFIVGKAIVKGAGGRGGRRYQIAAVLLTYMAVSLSAVPIAITQHMKQDSAQQRINRGDAAAVNAAPIVSLKAIGVLTLLGLASPFLALSDPLHGAIGLVILFVGIRIAWRLTAGPRVIISGPIHEPASAIAPC